MSFAAVIEEAAKKRAERAADAERVAMARRAELRELAAEADLLIDRRTKASRARPAPVTDIDLDLPVIDWPKWRPWFEERFNSQGRPSMRYYEMATVISEAEGVTVGWRQVAGAIAGLRISRRASQVS